MAIRSLSVTRTEFRATLGTLGLAQDRVARLFGVGPRSVRRWQHGDRRVPCGVSIVLNLLAAGVVTVAQVEQAAAPVPARTNGGADPRPPAPLPVAPVPAQPTLRAVTLADPELTVTAATTTAEKVCALSLDACRWPYGDPKHSDFHFCDRPAAKGQSYCEHHRALAYMPAPIRAARPPVTWRRLAFPSSPSLSLPARQDHTR